MRARLARNAVATALSAALVLVGVTGCTFITPQATTNYYDASDGIGTTLGELAVRNALLLSSDGTEASLLINLSNPTKYGVEVTLQYERADKSKVDQTLYVNSNSVAMFGGNDSGRIVLTGVDAKPGTLFPVFLQYDDVSGKQLFLPVLDGSIPQYSDLLPTATPTAP